MLHLALLSLHVNAACTFQEKIIHFLELFFFFFTLKFVVYKLMLLDIININNNYTKITYNIVNRINDSPR